MALYDGLMAEPRFIVDAMLGSLARWLRVLGFDTFYDATLDDADLVERSLAEERVLLTRDTRLVLRKRARNHLFIRSQRIEEQLAQVMGELGLRVRRDGLFGRCLRCNEPLVELPAEEARPRVPPFVARTQERFRRCPACERIYWRATHVDAMIERLGAMNLHRHPVRGPNGSAPPADD